MSSISLQLSFANLLRVNRAAWENGEGETSAVLVDSEVSDLTLWALVSLYGEWLSTIKCVSLFTWRVKRDKTIYSTGVSLNSRVELLW